MRIGTIETCVCCDHEPDCSDSVFFGMPQLRVCDSPSGTGYFTAFCPSCGRGGSFQYCSAYLALRAWNAMQEDLKSPDPLLFVDDCKEKQG